MTRNKYGAKKTEVDGVVFDSRAEARRYQELKLLERAGEIQSLTLQPTFVLQPSFKRGKRTVRAITYSADFQYLEGDKVIAEDVKALDKRTGKYITTAVFDVKAKMLEYNYPEIELRIVAA